MDVLLLIVMLGFDESNLEKKFIVDNQFSTNLEDLVKENYQTETITEFIETFPIREILSLGIGESWGGFNSCDVKRVL